MTKEDKEQEKNLTDVFADNQIPPRYWDQTASDIKILVEEIINKTITARSHAGEKQELLKEIGDL